MRVLITGICGFVGSTIAKSWLEHFDGDTLYGIDWLGRRGSEVNLPQLNASGVEIVHGDIRAASDFETLPEVDLVIDAAANPSVLAGVDGKTSSRQLVEHNLNGTTNILEYCKRHNAAFVLLSTSRVYSIPALCGIPLEVDRGAFRVSENSGLPHGVSSKGVSESFSTQAPISLYGATKLASEAIALEYANAFGFPAWVNRCGVMAGAGQFPRPDQGIFAFWLHSWANRAPLRYLGFEGFGHQVRDCLHPQDIVPLIRAQAKYRGQDRNPIVNLSGGVESSRSLLQLSEWCAERFGSHEVVQDASERPFDLPWVVLDPSLAKQQWDWSPSTGVVDILEEIALHAESDPTWLIKSS